VDQPLVTLADVEAARERISGRVLRTPLVELSGTGLRLKAESLQPIGAFKLRGAFNALLSLSEEERSRGVIADSSGNHAQAVAYAARTLHMRAVLVMPPYAPAVKIEATHALGAEVDLVEGDRATQARVARERAADEGLVLIPPFEHRDVIAGQGTLGLEISEDAHDVDLVLVPVSGGGLISGVAVALKALAPDARVVGVEPEAVDDARRSLHSGEIVANPPGAEKLTQADGLRVNHVGELTFAHIREFVDDILTVSEEEILDAVATIARRARLIAEPSGAVTTAAWLHHSAELGEARRAVAVLSGGNVDPALLAEALSRREQP
jgi:threonine dehydratase